MHDIPRPTTSKHPATRLAEHVCCDHRQNLPIGLRGGCQGQPGRHSDRCLTRSSPHSAHRVGPKYLHRRRMCAGYSSSEPRRPTRNRQSDRISPVLPNVSPAANWSDLGREKVPRIGGDGTIGVRASRICQLDGTGSADLPFPVGGPAISRAGHRGSGPVTSPNRDKMTLQDHPDLCPVTRSGVPGLASTSTTSETDSPAPRPAAGRRRPNRET